MNIQLKEKAPQKRSNSIKNDTVTPKVAQMILTGLTPCIVTLGKDGMVIDTPDGYPGLLLRANKLKRASTYNLTEVLAARDTLILLGAGFRNTEVVYAGANSELYSAVTAFKESGRSVLLLKDTVGDHLDGMGVELRIDYGGVALVKTTDEADGGDALE